MMYAVLITFSKLMIHTTVIYQRGKETAKLNKYNLDITTSKISAIQLASILKRIKDNTISGKIAKKIFEAIWNGEGKDADSIIGKNENCFYSGHLIGMDQFSAVNLALCDGMVSPMGTSLNI